MKKSQMTADLIIVSSLILIIFLTLFSIIDYRNTEIGASRRYLEAKDEAEKVAFAINEIYISGFGTSKSINVNNLTKDNFDLFITVLPKSRLVLVEWDEHFYTSPILTSRVIGNISGEIENMNISLKQGNLRLQNVRGEIQIEQ